MDQEVLMSESTDLFRISEGKPIRSGNQTLTVISKALVIPIPGVKSGLVWNWAAAVRVATAGAGEVTLPIHDQTRRWEVFFVISALTWLIASILLSKRS